MAKPSRGNAEKRTPQFGFNWWQGVVLPAAFLLSGGLFGQAIGPHPQEDKFVGLDTTGIHQIHKDYTPGQEEPYWNGLANLYYRFADQFKRKDNHRYFGLKRTGMTFDQYAREGNGARPELAKEISQEAEQSGVYLPLEWQ